MLLSKKSVQASLHNDYKKWLRHYLDFCHNHWHGYAEKESLKHFIVKLHEKYQSPIKQDATAQVVFLVCANFHILVNPSGSSYTTFPFPSEILNHGDSSDSLTTTTPFFGEGGVTKLVELSEKTQVKVCSGLFAEVKVRRSSLKTLRSYFTRVREFQTFHS